MHKNQRGYGAVELLLVVLFVGAVIGTGVVVASKHDSSKSDTNASTTKPVTAVAPASTVTPQDVTNKVKDYLASQYTLLDLQKNNQPKQGEASYSIDDTSPAYKADGYDFYVTYKGGSTLEAMPGPADWSATTTLPRATDSALRTKVADIYISFGLAKAGSRGGDTADIYQGKGLICTIEASSAQTSSDTASCGRIADYTKAAAQAKPFVAVLPTAASTTVISGLKISASPVSGYQKASATVSDINGDGAVSLFYRKNSSAWQYFTSTQAEIECSAYTTADLKAAFSGDACYDGSSAGATVH